MDENSSEIKEQKTQTGILALLQKMDYRLSHPIHQCFVGPGEIIITPFALAFNNKWGVTLVTVFIATYITKENARLDNTGLVEIGRAEQVYYGALYAIYSALLVLVTTLLKRVFARNRPENPRDQEPKSRSCRLLDLRS